MITEENEAYKDYIRRKDRRDYNYSDVERKAEDENNRQRARQKLLKRTKPIVSKSRTNIKQLYNRHPKREY